MAVEGFELSGRRCLIVGAGTPVGTAIASALAEAGARVVHGRILVGDADGLVHRAVDELGGLDVVVSCDGVSMAGPFDELTDAEWDRLLATNLTKPVRLLRAAGRHMLTHGGGHIIQVVSLLAERGVPNTAAYGATQAGLVQLIRALSLEWVRRNVRINGIGVGWYEGDPLLGFGPVPGPDSPPRRGEGPGEGFLRYLPMRRLGRPDEVGALAVYLASQSSDMMTGQTIWVDGGVMSHA